MFRILMSARKIVQFAQIVNTTNSHSIPALVLSHKSNYATAAPATSKITPSKPKSLNLVLNNLKNRIENKMAISKGDLHRLLTLLQSQQVDSAIALDILQCCAYPRVEKSGKAMVDQIWLELKKKNIQFQPQHYNSLLNAYRDQIDAEKAQEIFDEMIKAGIKPDAISYQCLLQTYCHNGNIEKAVEVLEMMDKENLYINEGSYNNLVQCQVICGNIDAAHETIANLKQSGFKLNYFTIEELLRYHAKTGNIDEIVNLIENSKKENIKLTSRDIFQAISDLAVNGHAEKVDTIIPYLKSTIGLRRYLENGITLFVEKRQSPLVPKLLKSAMNDTKQSLKFLIQEMVRLSTPEAEFKQTIENIESEGTTIENMFDVFKPAFEGPSEEVIRRLLAHMKSSKMEVSESLFEKLFQLAGKKGTQEVLNAVNLMCSDFGIQPQITFVRDLILPGLNAKENLALAFANLQSTKLRLRIIVMAVVNDTLNKDDLKTALEFMRSNQAFYGVDLIKRPLMKAFAKTGDVPNFVSIVRIIHDGYNQMNKYYTDKEITETQIRESQKSFIEETLHSAISNRRTDSKLITDLIKAFIEEGLSIGPEQAEKIQTLLGMKSETEIGRLLKKLSSETLELKPIKARSNTLINNMNQLNSADIQNVLEVKVAQGHNTMGTEKLLFHSYIREGNMVEIETMLTKAKFSLTNSDYALLIELYTRARNLENALNMLKRVCANNASFKLDAIKVARLVTLMVEKGRDFSEIEALLLAHRQGKPEYRIFVFEHLLDGLAENGNYNLVEKLFDALTKYSYLEPTIQSTAPLITAYLKSGKLVEAVDKYEYLSVTYNLVPMTMILFTHLIRHNEIDLLQRAFDVFEKLKGENVALCRLAFAFVECGQDRQARSLFENERTKNISKFISRECKEYVTYNRLDTAKTLLKTTNGLYCDRHIIYETILDIYVKMNKAQEALELWCEYSTENKLIPKPAFKTKLVKLLKENKMEIPFDLDSSESKADKNSSNKN